MLSVIIILAIGQSPLQQLQYEVKTLKSDVAALKTEVSALKRMCYSQPAQAVAVPPAAKADPCTCPANCPNCTGNCADCQCPKTPTAPALSNPNGALCWQHPDGRQEYMGPNGERTGQFYPTAPVMQVPPPQLMFRAPMFGGGAPACASGNCGGGR
jgi:hypothetical protein